MILYNFDQFVTPLWLWHTWWKFMFVTLPGSLWHGQKFVRYCPLSGHFSSVECWIWGGSTQQKPKLVFCDWKPQILSRITLSRSLWQTTLLSSALVTCDKDQISFRQVALWHVTDELIEIVQYIFVNENIPSRIERLWLRRSIVHSCLIGCRDVGEIWIIFWTPSTNPEGPWNWRWSIEGLIEPQGCYGIRIEGLQWYYLLPEIRNTWR